MSRPSERSNNLKEFTRRDFFKVGAAGVAGAAAFPLLSCGGSSSSASPTSSALALPSPSSNFFSVAVISDTQFYNCGTVPQPKNLGIFQAQTSYLAQNMSALKLSFVSHVGDVVEYGDGSTINYPANYNTTQNIEWLNAMAALDNLDAAGIPFALTIGNHDYDNMNYSNSTTPGSAYPPLVSTPSWWKNYFGSGSKYFKGKSWYGGASDSVGYVSSGAPTASTPDNGEYPAVGTLCNYGLSSYQIFSGGGKRFLHISLELEASNAAIAWAQNVINTYPGYATIVTTHSYISPPPWTDNNPPQPQNGAEDIPPSSVNNGSWYNTAAWMIGSPNGYNSPQSIWNNLIAPNKQIFMVLCGHSWTAISNTTTNIQPCGAGISKGENIRIAPNNYGSPVYQVLTDYQGNIVLGSGTPSLGGGDGWFRIMQFDMVNNCINFSTVNAWLTTQTGSLVLAGQKSGIYSDGMSDFDQPQGFSNFSLAMPVQVLNATAS
jgi:hypothetical protein